MTLGAASAQELDLNPQELTMYDTLRKEFSSPLNGPAEYRSFQRIGDTDFRCLAVASANPDVDEVVGIYLFTKGYTQRGPLFPPVVIQKILVNPSGDIAAMFDRVKMSVTPDTLVSTSETNESSYVRARFRQRGDLVFFSLEEKTAGLNSLKYGYCFPY